MASPYSTLSTLTTPQTSKAHPEQVENNAGGFVFALSPLKHLERFLILGTAGGTYYASEKEHTAQAFEAVKAAFDADPAGALDLIVDVSVKGRAHRQSPTLVSFAYACSHPAVKAAALTKVNDVCRTASMLFEWYGYLMNFRRKGRAVATAISNWYAQPVDRVAYQMAKYPSRAGKSHELLIGLTHPKPATPEHADLFRWVVGKGEPSTPMLKAIAELNKLDGKGPDSVKKVLAALDAHKGLSWEMLPSWSLNNPYVWGFIIANGMPMTAMIRNLGKMTTTGVFDDSAVLKMVQDALSSEAVRKAKVHPMSVLLAMSTYSAGRGVKGSLTWTPKRQIVDALDAAFYTSFGNVPATGKRRLIGLDYSGSMGSPISGTHLSCRQASTAMALISMAAGDDVTVIGFDARAAGAWGASGGRYARSGLTQLDSYVSPRRRLDDVINAMPLWGGGSTDCALPILWALETGKKFDSFEIYTDNETYYGDVHPYQALERYRAKTGIDAKLVVVGMTATKFSIANSSDPGMLDVVGFDSSAPAAIADFITG